MKKSSNIIVIISTLLIVLGVIFGSIFTNFDSTISTIVTTITAIIGAVALWIQFQKDREINQSSFIIEFHQDFYEHESNIRVLNALDKKFSNLDYGNFFREENLADILNYLSWVRIMCNLINRKVFTFDTIDETFAYKFFMITNNKEVQELELCKYPDIYRLVYVTHSKWTKYRKKHNLSIIMENEDLSKTQAYEKIINK